MTIQILNDFHRDGVFRDQQGTIWVRQSEMVAGMARAWDEGAKAQADAYGMEVDTGPSPYRAAKGEQK